MPVKALSQLRASWTTYCIDEEVWPRSACVEMGSGFSGARLVSGKVVIQRRRGYDHLATRGSGAAAFAPIRHFGLRLEMCPGGRRSLPVKRVRHRWLRAQDFNLHFDSEERMITADSLLRYQVSHCFCSHFCLRKPPQVTELVKRKGARSLDLAIGLPPLEFELSFDEAREWLEPRQRKSWNVFARSRERSIKPRDLR
jgi:hypothetical protein